MYRTNAQSTLVPDAIAIIAACTGSRAMMELAVALRAIVTGAVLLAPDRAETISRIALDLMNPRWNLEAHLTLNHPAVKYYAKMFCQACIQAVPLTPENPTRDLKWQQRVKEVLERDALLQSYAKVLLQHIKLRVTPAQPLVAPSVAANAPSSPKYDKAELHAKARQFAEEFVRRLEAKKAQVKAAKVSPPPVAPANPPAPAAEPTPPVQPLSIAEPAPVAIAAPEANSTPARENAPSWAHIPAVQFQGPWAMTKAERASVPSNVMVFPTERLFYRPVVDPVGTLGQFVDAQRGACGLSPP